MGFLESFVKNVFDDVVEHPVIGAILKVDLRVKMFFDCKDLTHTGVFLGNDEIAEVTAGEDGKRVVRIVDAETFIEGDDLFSRTGAFIYVACGKDSMGSYPLGSAEIANRARAAVSEGPDNYSVLFNNCHMFSQYCITGTPHGASPLLGGVENALERKFGVGAINWCSTGACRGNAPYLMEPDDTDYKDQLRLARRGNRDAIYNVAECLYYGYDVAENEAEALKWYRKAADLGHPEAMLRVGQFYYYGDVVEENASVARKYIAEAKRMGAKEADEWYDKVK